MMPLIQIRHPHDLTAEIRAWHSARRRKRIAACAGASLFCVLAGLGLGVLAGGHSVGHALGIVAVSAWGTWSMHYLFTRH